MLKKFGAVCLAAVLLLTGCSLRPQENGSKVQSISRPAVESAELQFTHPAAGDTVAVFDTSAGVFRAVLFPEKAPQACDNFIGLVQQGYYNGLTVSRVENQFVVEAGQGADGKGSTIWKGSRYPVEASDSLHHYAGALCMGVDASGACASVFYVVESLPGDQSVTQELTDQMNAAGYRGRPVAPRRPAGDRPQRACRAGTPRGASCRRHCCPACCACVRRTFHRIIPGRGRPRRDTGPGCRDALCCRDALRCRSCIRGAAPRRAVYRDTRSCRGRRRDRRGQRSPSGR